MTNLGNLSARGKEISHNIIFLDWIYIVINYFLLHLQLHSVLAREIGRGRVQTL